MDPTVRVTELRAFNYMNLRALMIDIPTDARVVLLAGPNGAGKTSLIEGIRWALGGPMPRSTDKKKDLPELITEGEKDGWFSLTLTDAEGNQGQCRISLKTGNYVGAPPAELGAWSLSLTPQAFMELEPSKRRHALFDRAGISLKPDRIARALIDKGNPEAMVDEVRKALGAGFDAAAQTARDLYLEARGSWQAITGEAYGDVKAKDWAAHVPTSWDDPKAARAAEEDAEARMVKARSELDLLTHSATLAGNAGALRELAAQADKIAAEVESFSDRLTVAREHLKGLEAKPAGGCWTAPCPDCGALLRTERAGHLVLHGRGENVPDANHAAVLKSARQKVTDLEAKLADANARRGKADGAASALAGLPEAPTRAELDAARSEASIASANLDAARSARRAAEDAHAAAANAAQNTEKARVQYERIQAFVKLGQSITNLPAEYLDDAVHKINTGMGELSKAFGEPVVLGKDMELYYGTIPWRRMSESQQWRAALALGAALARGQGGVVLMDKFDDVEVPARVPILKALGQIEGVQFIIAATLKEPPAMPPGYFVHWLGKGE